MSGFYGRHQLTLDSKGRISLPARFRDLTEKSDNGDQIFIITRGTSEKYIALFTIAEWTRVVDDTKSKVDNASQRRILDRQINFNTSTQKVDKQGRINIPDHLIEYAGLEKNVAVIGTGKKIEIWNPDQLDKNIESESPIFTKKSDILEF
jgi:MraZ protein